VNLRSIVFSVIFILSFHAATKPQQLEELRAVKLTETDSQILFTDENIAEAMDYLASIGINAVLPVVLNGGYTQYPSAVMDSLFAKPIDPKFSGRDPLARVIIEAHRNGIEVYPWFEYGFASYYSGGTPPFGGHILQTYPNWACKTSDGQIATKNGFDWMSGIHPEVQDFILSLVDEVIQNYDLDGVEFSDRIPAMPVEGGYEEYTVELYKDENNGNEPPANYSDANWIRWRADKLNEFYADVNSLVKGFDENLFVASSPSIYPWAYQEYLQDPPTWVNEGIVDHFVPQLYRYNLADYIFELNKSINQIDASKRDRIFAGILMNVGSYIISPDFLLNSMQTNRDKNINGEAFFFYEGLRKNNDELGDTIHSVYYSEPAIVPLRNGFSRRPKADIVNEDDSSSVNLIGTWQTIPFNGFQPNILVSDQADYTSIEYLFNISMEAWYDVYAYMVPNTINSDSAHYTIYNSVDSSEVYVDQSNLNKKGWQKLSTEFLPSGLSTIVKLDNQGLEAGKYISADAVMLMINRKLSPDAVITSINNRNISKDNIPGTFYLNQNYPNPFNPATTIEFMISEPQLVSLKIYNLLGEEIAVLLSEHMSEGLHRFNFNAEELASGIYFYKLTAGKRAASKKMILLK
jgi:uncharacterized lipoprotein YddW (UPF0748 family)